MNIEVDRIRQELRDLNQWLVWRTERRDGKPTKVPYQACRPNRHASATKLETWAPFEDAVQALADHPHRLDGVGFVLTQGDPFTGIDIDSCLDDSGQVNSPEIQTLVRELDTYTEVSPSGLGLRLFLRGEFRHPQTGRPGGTSAITGAKKIEIYSALRYLTVTGDPLALDGLSDEIEERQEELDALAERLWPLQSKSFGSRSGGCGAHAPNSDHELLTAARNAKNGAKFAALYDHGDLSGHEEDHSRADLALCTMLAHRTGSDPERIDRLFRDSALIRDKWRDRADYRDATISKAIEVTRSGVHNGSAGAGTTAPSTARIARQGPPLTPTGSGQRPVVVYQPENLAAVEDEAERILGANRSPRLFQRSSCIVQVVPQLFFTERDQHGVEASRIVEENEIDLRDGASQRYVIRPLRQPALKSELSRAMVFKKQAGPGLKEIPVPQDVVRGLHEREHWKHLRPLVGISDVPLIRSDGSLHASQGYDEQTGYFVTCKLNLNCKGDLADARKAAAYLLSTVFRDFPFASKHDRAAAVAALLSSAARPSLNAPIPAFMGRSPIRGSGKTLLFKAIQLTVTGQLPFVTQAPAEKDEWRKALFSFALEGLPELLFDNLESGRAFGSPALDMALTTQEVSDRVLGMSKIGTARMNSIFYFTGNNIAVRGDFARRVIPIDQNPATDRPELRHGFRCPDLLGWVRQNRRRILEAVFTILVAHAKAGRPRHGGPALGSFEKWDLWIRSAILWLGLPDPCLGMEQVHEEGDVDVDARKELLLALQAIMDESPRISEITTGEIVARARMGEESTPTRVDGRYQLSPSERLFQALRPENGWKLNTKRVGYQLRAAKNSPAGGLVLRGRRNSQNAAEWWVEAQGAERGRRG